PRLNPDHGPSATVGKLSQFLFHDQGFRGNQESYFDPENSFLDSVLESKQGIPITLSILCLLLGRRLGLPLVGVGLPCHFIVKFEDPENPVYFDPFNEGRILTRKGCSDLVRSFGLNFETRFLVPATPRETLIRMLHNLTMIYNRTHEDAKARQLTEYSQILLRRG
ncbi:MAG: transglutaminase family protein, partial [Nitrospinaceae bacterium]